MPEHHPYGADPSQFGELFRPARASLGTVVIIHGGFWRARYDLSLGRPLAADLAMRGYTAWNVEYRRVGNGGGWPSTFDDIATGIDRLADLEVDTSAVVAIGHSAGGLLAVWAAARVGARVPVTGVVSQAGVLGLVRAAEAGVGERAVPDLMGGMPSERPDAYRQADAVAAVPVLCVHARADADVPFWMSVDYVAAAGGSARLVEVEGDHYTLIDPESAAWELVVSALPGLFGH